MKKTTLALFLGAIVLLLFSGVNGARAALNYYSEDISSTLVFDQIDVSLVEKNDDASAYGEVSGDKLLSGLVPEGEEFILGKKYPEYVAVKNSGSIEEFVRVSVYKYWVDKAGKKDTSLDPSLIEIGYSNSGWLRDAQASTVEREVFYYSKALEAGAVSSPLIESVQINPVLASKVRTEQKKTGNTTVITTYYDYDGETFVVSCKVDSVQTHNAKDAIYSVWGKNVTVSGSTLSIR